MKSMIPALFLILVGMEAGAATVYRCDGMGDSRGESVTLTVVSKSVVKVDEDKAILDRNYNPRLNIGYSRFEYEHSEEGTTEVLVQQKLLDTGKGIIKIQGRGEGWGTTSYYCHL